MSIFDRTPVLAAFALLVPLASAQEPPRSGGKAAVEGKGAKDAPKVYRKVSPETLEAILKDLKIDAAKSQGKVDGIHFYDYAKNDFKIRLHNYQGKDLWIDAQFPDKLSLENVNKWNVMAKFSRAVRLKSDGEPVALEAQLDCLGGTTDAIVRQFIERFDGELIQFSKYAAGLPK
jgi:hypothetical protein